MFAIRDDLSANVFKFLFLLQPGRDMKNVTRDMATTNNKVRMKTFWYVGNSVRATLIDFNYRLITIKLNLKCEKICFLPSRTCIKH